MSSLSGKNTFHGNDLKLLQRRQYGGDDTTDTSSPKVVQIPNPPNDSAIHQGIIDFLLVIGILMGITILLGIIIYTYIYRKRLTCKQNSVKSSDSHKMIMNNNDDNDNKNNGSINFGTYDNYNNNNTNNNHEDYYEHYNKRNNVIGAPGSGITRGKSFGDDGNESNVPVSRSDTFKSNRSDTTSKTSTIKTAKSLDNKSSLLQLSSQIMLPSVSVYDKERASSLTNHLAETNSFQPTRPVPPIPAHVLNKLDQQKDTLSSHQKNSNSRPNTDDRPLTPTKTPATLSTFSYYVNSIDGITSENSLDNHTISKPSKSLLNLTPRRKPSPPPSPSPTPTPPSPYLSLISINPLDTHTISQPSKSLPDITPVGLTPEWSSRQNKTSSPSPSRSSSPTPSSPHLSRSYNNHDRESDLFSIYNYYSTKSFDFKTDPILLPEVRITTEINIDGLFSNQSELNLDSPTLNNVSGSQVNNNKETTQEVSSNHPISTKDFDPEENDSNDEVSYYF